MSALLIAHAGHWLSSVGFAAGPLLVVGFLVAMVLLQRRRDGHPEPR